MDNTSNQTPSESATPRNLVNPVALQNCSVQFGEVSAPVLDISFVRLVVADEASWVAPAENEPLTLNFHLDRFRFSAIARFQGRGEGWIRFGFEKILPSAGAHLRSFLSPKRIGESIVEDWRTDQVRHFHGLNESELWFDQAGGILFSYLDNPDHTAQFIIRMSDSKSLLRVGKILRKNYMELSNIDQELPLLPLTDRDTYAKLGECRDVVTNFRPNGQLEYNLKQRLLKVISEHLYSTSRKVEMAQPRPSRPVSSSMMAD